MVLKEQVYSVLVASAPGKVSDALAKLLPEGEYAPVSFASNAAAARRLWAERNYDFVLVNAPLPDELGSKLATDVSHGPGTVALLLVKAEVHDEVRAKVLDHGVFTLSKPTSPQMLLQALQWMAAARERLRGLERKAATVEEKMEEIRLVNRAKWLLIEVLSMTEADAHRYIEKQAMDRCVPRREIAQSIIRTYS